MSVRVRLTRLVSPLVLTATAVALLSILAAVLLQRPYLLELGLPCLVVVVVGLVLDGPASVVTASRLASDRLVEGEDAEIVVLLRGSGPSGRVVIELPPPPGVHYAPETPAVRDVELSPSGTTAVRFRVQAPSWGVHRWRGLQVRVPAPLGLVSYEGAVTVDLVLRVLPEAERLGTLARTSRTSVSAGSRIAAAKGSGFEFADIRPFHPGDRRRDVNWRASARRGELRVNDRHPERSTDVVLMLDAFPSAGLAEAIKATASLASAYLAERDRVGLVRFGGFLEWLTPAMGPRQLYRIADVLLEASALPRTGWGVQRRLPRQALPARALVLAVTPLVDPSSIATVTQVAAEGLRLAVVEVTTTSLVPPLASAADRFAYQLWNLEVEESRDLLRDRGVPVVAWDVSEPLAPVIEEVAAFQRYARHRTG